MKYNFMIPGKLPGMNQFISELCKSKYAGADMKREWQSFVCSCIKQRLRNVRIDKKIVIHYTFYEQERRRDLDNIAGFAHKVVQDALVSSRTIKNDGWKEVVGFTDRFKVDSRNPRIEVTLEEVE